MIFTEDFFNEIQKQYSALDEKEKQVIREFLHNSAASKILRKSFGEQYEEVVRMVRAPNKKKRGIASPR
jgi:polyhydroxyalkanoate synthesis regulator phasin